MSQSAEKCKRGDPFRLINTHSVENNKKLKEGTLWGH